MKSLCIKTNNSNWLDYLLNELKALDLPSICFSRSNFKHYENIIIHYTGEEEKIFFEKISYLLSFLVIDEIEETFLKDLLLQHYFYFDIDERNTILGICYDILADDFSRSF